jgi:hypothetical protein
MILFQSKPNHYASYYTTHDIAIASIPPTLSLLSPLSSPLSIFLSLHLGADMADDTVSPLTLYQSILGAVEIRVCRSEILVLFMR